MRQNRTPWPKTPNVRVKTIRSIKCLREDDGWHPRCEKCGWFAVEGLETMDDATWTYDLHGTLCHQEA